MDLKANEIASWRLRSQHLLQPRWQQPKQVVTWLGGVQAQDYHWAKWSIGLRMPDSTDATVQHAIAGGTIVRTWAVRGTLHFVAAADIHWLLPLLAPRIYATNKRRYWQLGLDEATLARSTAVIGRALEGGRRLIRSQIAAVLEADGISAAGQRMPYMLQRAALEGVICQGPPEGREPTYVLLSEWIRGPGGSVRGGNLADLADRYFASHGPASAQDFAWWAGLAMSAAREAIEGASLLVPVTSKGMGLWATEEKPPEPSSAPEAHALSPFDGCLLGYKDRSAALDLSYAKRVNAGGGMPKPTIILNSKVVAVWKRWTKDGKLVAEVEAFRSLSKGEERLVDNAVRRYAAFAQLPLDDMKVR